MKETTLQTPRSMKKEGGGSARDARAENRPLQLVMKDHGGNLFPCSPSLGITKS